MIDSTFMSMPSIFVSLGMIIFHRYCWDLYYFVKYYIHCDVASDLCKHGLTSIKAYYACDASIMSIK